MWPCILYMYTQLLRKYFNYNDHDPEEFSMKHYIFTKLCSSVPRIALLSMNFRLSNFFCVIYFFDMDANAMFKAKSKWSRKIRLITGKPAYWATCIGRFVLFCAFQSAESCQISHLEKKMPLSQVKLFKPPVVRETISIIQKTFSRTGVFLPYKSNKNIAAPWDLHYEFNRLIDSSWDLRRDYSQS